MKLIFLFPLLLTLQAHPVGKKVNKDIDHIFIINSFDAKSMRARNNKKELFGQLADSLKQMIKDEFDRTKSSYANREATVIPEFIAWGTDSIYKSFVKDYPSGITIVIKDLNAYFTQTGVEVTKDGNHKDRVASYDINADVTYVVYGNPGRVKEFNTKVWEFFTDRSVISGLLAAGPDIVGKRKHAFKILEKNAEQFVREVKVYFEK